MSLLADVAQLKTEVAALQSRAAELEADNAELVARSADQQKQIDALNAAVGLPQITGIVPVPNP